jgi:hypothetical protein
MIAPQLEPGRVYRTQDFATWTKNPPRLAKRLVARGLLVPVSRGLFVHPAMGRFGSAPPTDEALMRAFLKETPFVFTGPDRWNALALGTTASAAATFVYNTKRSGRFTLANRPFELRRVAFPESPTPEWFVIDLFENAAAAGTVREALCSALVNALRKKRFRPARLGEMAARYATGATRTLIDAALATAAP